MSLDEMREVQLYILDCIHDYCTKNNLRYSLGGGSLLGAIRHRGYIPWDDDIDVMLPRADYDKLIEGFEGNYEHCRLHHYGNDKTYPFFFAKIYDDRTELTTDLVTNGVNVDVFPIDGMPEEMKSGWYFWRLIHEQWAFHLYGRKWTSLSWKEKCLRIIYPSKRLLWKIHDRYIRSYSFETSPSTGCAVGRYAKKELMGPDSFKRYVNVEFENRICRAIADYDEYLKKHYGDYMKLPPENKRKSHGSKAYTKSK